LPPDLKSRVHFAPFLSDAELRALYGAAVAVLYPTLYEGFGFPVVEAQAAGVPVVFSAVSSLSELIGPLALVAATDDLQGWCRALHDSLSMGDRRLSLAAEARSWAQRFSWQASLAAHLDVYRDVAARRRRAA
jgi:alpha-1,3-rhamnosyl/mannosyltransferase